MNQHVIPIPCKPWTFNGLPDDLIVGHYEDTYGAAVRTLNAVRDRLATLDLATAPAYDVRALKREELEAMGSVTLHELYFGSLGGDGERRRGLDRLNAGGEKAHRVPKVVDA